MTDYRVLDNQWLTAVVQGGLVGLSALILLSAGAMVGMTAALRTAKLQKDRDLAFALGASIIGILVSSATFDLFSFSQATFIFFLLFGLIWSAAGRTAIRQQPNTTDAATV